MRLVPAAHRVIASRRSVSPLHPPRRRVARRDPPRDESGGAASLWVVMLVPVLVLGAVAAMAVPERMAAQATMEDVALDLATLAVAWRATENVPRGTIDSFVPECVSTIDTAREALCRGLWEPVVTDLGLAGIDVTSVRGFYSDLYTASDSFPDRPPCRIYGSAVLLDAVHVALVADWYGSWAASQVWPDGTRQGAEAVGRLQTTFFDASASDPADDRGNECGQRFTLHKESGEPGWLGDPDFEGRRMAESIPLRTTFSG